MCFAAKSVGHDRQALHCLLRWRPGLLGDAMLHASSKPHSGRMWPGTSPSLFLDKSHRSSA